MVSASYALHIVRAPLDIDALEGCTASHLCHEVSLQCASHKTHGTRPLTAAITDVFEVIEGEADSAPQLDTVSLSRAVHAVLCCAYLS